MLILTAGFVLLGCASRPSENALTNSIIRANDSNPASDVSEEHARCVAKKILDSNLSDTTLSAMAENFNKAAVLKSETTEAKEVIKTASDQCLESPE